MWILVAGLVIFFGAHSVRVFARPFRDAQVAAEAGRWMAAYSIVPLVGLAFVVWGWWIYRADAPEVFASPDWGHPAALVLVLLGFISLSSAYSPLGYFKRAAQHPFLTGVALWSVGHLLVNGDLASLLLFGAFLIYLVIDRIAVAFRPAPAMDAPSIRGDIIAIAVGAVAYAAFGFWLQPWLFGAAPFA